MKIFPCHLIFRGQRLTVLFFACALLALVESYGQCPAPTPSGQTGCPGNYTLMAISLNSTVTLHKWYTSPSGGGQVSPTTAGSDGAGNYLSSLQANFTGSVTYWVAAVCNGITESTRQPVTFTSTSNTISISASSDAMAVTPGSSVTLTASSSGGSYQWRYGNSTSGSIGGSSVNATMGGMYYADGFNNCSVAQSGSIQVNFLPTADAGPDRTVVGTSTATFTFYGSGSDQDGDAINSFSWTKESGGAITLTNANTSALTLSGLPTTSLPQSFVFKLTVTDSNNKSHSDFVTLTVVSPPSNNNNYTVTETIKVPSQTTNAQVSALTITGKGMQYEYVDGLGRSIQSIAWQSSPSGTDILQPYEYDELHRQKRSYLPIQQSQTNGLLLANLLGNGTYVGSTHQTTYNSGIAGVQGDAKPYSEAEYELSPLGRIKKQGSVGTNFQINVNDIDLGYGTNVAADVRLWSISANLPVSSATWEAALLQVTSTTDQQGVESQEISSRQGLKILTRTKIDATNWVETYYVYDDRNNLRFVLPPELIRIIKSPSFRNPTQAEIDAWAYQKVYDTQGRVIESKGPGLATVDWTYSVYDKRNRVVLTQDPEQRIDNEWSYIKYDELNRPVISGIYRPGSNITRSAMQTNVDALSSNQGYQNIEPKTVGGVKTGLDIVIYAYEGINDYRAINSIVIKPGFMFTAGVTAASFVARIDDGSGGTSADAFPTTNDEPLVITQYDDYKQCGICQDENFAFVNTETWVGTSNESFTKTDFVKDRPISVSTKLVVGPLWLHTVSYYNRNGAVIQTTSSDHVGGRTRSSSLVDFSGKVLENLKTYVGLNIPLSTIRRRFSYDNAGRLLITYHRINSQPEVVLSSLQYNPVGQLIDKKIHSEDNGTTYLQSLDYRYNIRGEMLATNSTTGTDAGDPADYFAVEFGTDNTFGALNTARYDGLLNSMKWRTALPDATSKVKQEGYAFSYNNLGWLTSSTYKLNMLNGGTNWDLENTFFNEDGVTYDYNGNIQQLARKAKTSSIASTVIDQLQYNYGSPTGNKLWYVTDNASDATHKTKGLSDGNTSGNDYDYDKNGNLTMDKNKAIQSISYNFLNLPDRITFNNNSYIQYLYDASGGRLSQTYYNTTTQTTLKTDYVADLQLINDQLQFIFHEEGRVVQPDYNNLVPTPAREANGTEGYHANASVQITSEAIGGQSYVKVVCNQSSSNPGVYPIGDGTAANAVYPVKAGQSYSFKVLGYQSVGTNAKLFVWTNLGNLIWPGVLLPQGSANETWVTATFTVPAGATQVKLGVLWEGGGIGNTCYINRIALYKTDFEYQYFLVDQVGSPRVVLGSTPSKLTYTATMETENFGNESTTFLNLNSSKYEVNPTANATPGGNEALRMNNTYRVGPARSFKVFPGDVIDASAQAYYTTSSGLTQTAGATMASALATVMNGGTIPGLTDGVNTAYTNSGSGLPGFLLSPFQGSSKPSAFINYILFDENYKPLEAKSQPIGSAATRHLVTLPQISVKETGTVFIYLSYDNESTHPVFFDDFKIVYTESPVIQINDYYAFGMLATEWVRDGEIDNNFLFQGKELNDQTGLHDFHARQYDAALGRWLVMDPTGQFSSPYNGMGNNPVMGVDPDGRFWHILIGAAVGGVVNLAIEAIEGDVNSFGEGAAAFGIGAFQGGLAAATMGGSSYGTVALNSGLRVASSQIQPIQVPIGDRTVLSFSLSFGYGGGGLSFGGNVMAFHQFSEDFSIQLGGGLRRGEFETAAGYGGGFSYRDHSLFYGRSHFSGAEVPDQTTGMFSWGHEEWSYNLENDLFGDGGDRYRSASASIGYKEYEVGFHVWTNDGTQKRESTADDSMFGPHVPRRGKAGIAGVDQGTWRDGIRYSSPLFLGVRVGGVQNRFGVDAPWVQDATQNFVHRYLTRTTPYFPPGKTRGRPWFYTGSYYPFTLY